MPDSFTDRTGGNKVQPTVLHDSQHGTKVKLWPNHGKNGDFETISIERSFKRNGATEFETQKVSIGAKDIDGIIEGMAKGKEIIAAKEAERGKGQER